MIISTSYIDLGQIKTHLGIVTATCVSGIGVAKDAMAAIVDFTGGRISGYEDAIQQASFDAIALLKKNAESLNADAVMGIQISNAVFSPHGKGTVIGIIAYGTAVKLKQIAVPMRHDSLDEIEQQPESEVIHRRAETPVGAGFEWGR